MENYKKAYLAGGCFWGLEQMFRDQNGVIDTEVGYASGASNTDTNNPTYENHDGYAEAIEVTYDPKQTTYEKLLDFFFRVHNPTTLNQQGNDIGTSYRSAIFFTNDEEQKIAQEMIALVDKSKRWHDKVVTAVEELKNFSRAEDYHQDYLVKNPHGYTCHTLYFDQEFKK